VLESQLLGRFCGFSGRTEDGFETASPGLGLKSLSKEAGFLKSVPWVVSHRMFYAELKCAQGATEPKKVKELRQLYI